MLLGVFSYFIWLAVAITSGLQFSVFIKDTWFIVVSSFIAFLLCGTKYMFDDVRRLHLGIREIFNMTDANFESFFIHRHKRIFSSRHLLIGIPIIMALLMYEFVTRSYWIPRAHNFAIYLIGIVYWTMICLIFGMASWCAGWGIEFYRWIGYEAPLRLSPLREDKAVDLSPITRQHMIATFLIAIGMSFLILLSEAARFVILGFCIFLILIFFFAPQYYIHRRLVKVKKKMLEEIGGRLYERSVDFLRTLDKGANNKDEARLDINTLELLFTNIKIMREWPFDLGNVLNVIGVAIVPILVFVLQLLLLQQGT